MNKIFVIVINDLSRDPKLKIASPYKILRTGISYKTYFRCRLTGDPRK